MNAIITVASSTVLKGLRTPQLVSSALNSPLGTLPARRRDQRAIPRLGAKAACRLTCGSRRPSVRRSVRRWPAGTRRRWMERGRHLQPGAARTPISAWPHRDVRRIACRNVSINSSAAEPLDLSLPLHATIFFIAHRHTTAICRARYWYSNPVRLSSRYAFYPHFNSCSIRATYFSERVVNVWNRLSSEIIDFSSLASFRRSLEATDLEALTC